MSWFKRAGRTPVVLVDDEVLRDRVATVELRVLAYLDEQANLADPEDKNDEAIDLALDVARALQLKLPARDCPPPSVPVVPGRPS